MSNKWKIVLVSFPFTDLSGQKVRPALVLYDSGKGEDYILAFISSLKQKRLGSFDVPIPASIENGLKVDSVIKLEKLATLQKKIVLGEFGKLDPSLFKNINKKLLMIFGL